MSKYIVNGLIYHIDEFKGPRCALDKVPEDQLTKLDEEPTTVERKSRGGEARQVPVKLCSHCSKARENKLNPPPPKAEKPAKEKAEKPPKPEKPISAAQAKKNAKAATVAPAGEPVVTFPDAEGSVQVDAEIEVSPEPVDLFADPEPVMDPA